jgi:hypothetical protein
MQFSTDCQQLVSRPRGWHPTPRASWRRDAPTAEQSCPKQLNPNPRKAPELTANLQEIRRTGEQAKPHHGNLQEIRRTGEQAKPHHGDITGESRTMRNFIGWTIWSFSTSKLLNNNDDDDKMKKKRSCHLIYRGNLWMTTVLDTNGIHGHCVGLVWILIQTTE